MSYQRHTLVSIIDASISKLLKDYLVDVVLPDLNSTPIFSIKDLSVIITGIHASAKEMEGTTEEYTTHVYDALAVDVDHLMRWMKAHQIMFIHIDSKEMDKLEVFVRNM